MRTRKTDLMTTIRDTGALPDGDALAQAVTDFKARLPADRDARGAEANVTATGAAAVGPETSPETLETE